MIIDSPIVSGSFLSTGSLSQIGNATITGSLNVSGSGISLTDGTFSGSGANLFNIPASGIVGLNLSQIASGSVSASIAPDKGLLINTSVSASNFTGSFTGSLTGIATSASFAYTASSAVSSYTASSAVNASASLISVTSSYSFYALTSSYSLGGSGFPFSGSAVITGSLLVSGSGVTITGSLSLSTLTTGSGVRYVIADANGLISAQTASAAIFVTQKDIASAGQTSFNIVNGYSTGYVTVFVNGTKLAADEYTDTSGTTIVLATGSMANDVVEFQKYMPAAGVSNNALRQINYFTTTLGQTNFTVNYTPGLLDVFYNGSKLSNVEYTANNGTSITLATGSNSGDTLEVDVYSYQVGAFSGIGGSGAANQLAYFNTTNSITGSNKVTYDGSTLSVTGSFLVSGSSTFTNIGPAIFSGSVTSLGGFSGSFTGSFIGSADSASLSQNSLLLSGTGSVGFTTTGSFTAVSSSFSSRTTQIERVYATTGSNGFTANQAITGSLTVTGQIIAQSLNVQQVTSSIVYSSGSNTFGCNFNSRQTFTGSFYQTGSVAIFNSNVGVSATPSSWAAPFNVIEGGSYGQHIGFQTNNADMKIGVNNYYNGGYIYHTTGKAASQLNIGADGGFNFNTAACGIAGNAITFTEVLSINNAGRVGISMPPSTNYKLGVSGSSYINGSNNKGVFITDNANFASIVGLNSAIAVYNPIELRASGTDYQLYLGTTGNVGIGTCVTNVDRLRIEGSVFATSNMYTSNEGTGFMVDANPVACNARVGLMKYGGFEGMLVSGNATQVRLGHRTDSNFVSGGSPTIRTDLAITADGLVYVYNLAGSGTRTVTADSSGLLAASSDSSLKQEDTTHEIEGLTEILQLQPRAYKWLKDIETRGEEATTEIGFFADEVASIIPSAAPKNQDGLYGFYDRAILAALVKGMQEQQCTICSQSSIINTLKTCIGII